MATAGLLWRRARGRAALFQMETDVPLAGTSCLGRNWRDRKENTAQRAKGKQGLRCRLALAGSCHAIAGKQLKECEQRRFLHTHVVVLLKYVVPLSSTRQSPAHCLVNAISHSVGS